MSPVNSPTPLHGIQTLSVFDIPPLVAELKKESLADSVYSDDFAHLVRLICPLLGGLNPRVDFSEVCIHSLQFHGVYYCP